MNLGTKLNKRGNEEKLRVLCRWMKETLFQFSNARLAQKCKKNIKKNEVHILVDEKSFDDLNLLIFLIGCKR